MWSQRNASLLNSKCCCSSEFQAVLIDIALLLGWREGNFFLMNDNGIWNTTFVYFCLFVFLGTLKATGPENSENIFFFNGVSQSWKEITSCTVGSLCAPSWQCILPAQRRKDIKKGKKKKTKKEITRISKNFQIISKTPVYQLGNRFSSCDFSPTFFQISN